MQVAFAAPAAAAGSLGLERTVAISPFDMTSPKFATATCPRGKVTVGGGAWIQESSDSSESFPRRVRLMWLQPSLVGFVAGAEAPDNSSAGRWRIDAYAICADAAALDRYAIVPGVSESGSGTFKKAAARCPDGTVAFGSGAYISYSTPFSLAKAGLQMVRTSGPLDIARATGREYAGGFAGDWGVVAWAICAKPAAGIRYESTITPGDDAQGRHTCSGGSFVHGPGGGGGLIDGGGVFLRGIYPDSDLRSILVGMTGTFPDRNVLASPTCAR